MIFAICLSGCGTQAPKPPTVEECGIIAVEGLDPYLKCQLSDGSVERWKLTIPEANKYMCTTPQGYAAGKAYEKELKSWIAEHCKN